MIKDKRCGKNDILDPLLDPQTEDLRGKIRKYKVQKAHKKKVLRKLGC